jgi:hypothetical protein
MVGKVTNNRNFCSIFFILIFIFYGCQKNQTWIDTLPKPWTLSEAEFSSIIKKFNKRYPDFNDRLKQFSKWQVGKPYKIFCLGEETLPDLDPIFRMDVSDCTVHILRLALMEKIYQAIKKGGTLQLIDCYLTLQQKILQILCLKSKTFKELA